jgi:hypothetical protein
MFCFQIRNGGKAAPLLTKPAASGDAKASPQGRPRPRKMGKNAFPALSKLKTNITLNQEKAAVCAAVYAGARFPGATEASFESVFEKHDVLGGYRPRHGHVVQHVQPAPVGRQKNGVQRFS